MKDRHSEMRYCFKCLIMVDPRCFAITNLSIFNCNMVFCRGKGHSTWSGSSRKYGNCHLPIPHSLNLSFRNIIMLRRTTFFFCDVTVFLFLVVTRSSQFYCLSPSHHPNILEVPWPPAPSPKWSCMVFTLIKHYC